jgi:hypothetical protein
MGLALKQIKVYGKLVLTGVVVLAILLIIIMTRGRTVDVWLFREYLNVSVLLLILVTAVASVAAWWGLSKIIGIWREVCELRRHRAAELQAQEQRKAAADMCEREKRIDEKIRRSLNDDV